MKSRRFDKLCNYFNVITVDIEEWFHGLEPDPSQWSGLTRRLHTSTEKLLELFQELDIKATFFVLGDVAKHTPSLVEQINSEGHEIGSHGMYHRFIYNQTPAEFREDLKQSIDILVSIINKPVKLYRAPYFSITKNSLWALEILREEGIVYDSSIFPIYNHRYGIKNSPRIPYKILSGLWEWPISTLPFWGSNIPFAGGFYFRFWPHICIEYALSILEKRKEPVLFYFHPWEFDPDQPRLNSNSWFNSYRHYYKLSKNFRRFKQLLYSRKFTSLSSGIQNYRQLNSKKKE
ncbi:MAG: DUF3473 domain-containing protein [candidate division Zixibacteria bacterium]|nr:DUF3473 domain-containing protein [candidate division Zixibacteria bacterium]